MKAESGAFHRDLCAELERAVLPGGRLVGVCPRFHAKSTWGTIILPAYCLAKRLKGYIVIWSATQLEAQEKLQNIIAEFDDNEALRDDYTDEYGYDFGPKLDSKGRPWSDRDDQLILNTGAKIQSLQFMGRARGKMFRGLRPDLHILDDPEDEKEANSDTWRRKAKDWYDGPLMRGMDHTGSLIHLGTIVHHDSILMQVMFPKDKKEKPAPRWRRFDRRDCWVDSVNRIPLWPEYWPASQLDAALEDSGSLAFNREMRNIPIDPNTQRFKHEWWKYYSPTNDNLHKRGNIWYIKNPRNKQELKHLRVVMGVDLALGEKKHHDFSCYVVLGAMFVPELARPLMFLLHVERVKISPLAQVDKLRQLYEEWQPSHIGIDSTVFQIMVTMAAAQAGLPVVALHAHQRKEERIDTSAIPVEQGLVFLPDPGSRPWVRPFTEEAEAYPGGANDDQLDGFANAQIVLAGGGGPQGSSVYTSQRKNTLRTLTRGGF